MWRAVCCVCRCQNFSLTYCGRTEYISIYTCHGGEECTGKYNAYVRLTEGRMLIQSDGILSMARARTNRPRVLKGRRARDLLDYSEWLLKLNKYCRWNFNPLTPKLNPSAQRCLTRFFTGDFASWTLHFFNICVKKNQQMQQLFIQFINYIR
jgi:hypothetical protein